MRALLIRWVVSAFALWLTAYLLPGFVQVSNFWGALLAAAVLGLVNAAMLGLAALLAGDALNISGFWGAVVGSIGLTVVSLALNLLVGKEEESKSK